MSTNAEDFWIKSASSAALNPVGWYVSAEQLWRAAAILRQTWQDDLQTTFSTPPEQWRSGFRPPPQVGGAFMMLTGYALEVLMKGIAVADNPSIVQSLATWNDKMVNWHGSGHNLKGLTSLIKFPIDTTESKILARLEAFIMWGGRYPIALRPLDMRHGPEPLSSPTSFSTEDFPVIDALWERLLSRFASSVLARQQANAHRDTAALQARRDEIVEDLKLLTRHDEDGVTVFENPTGVDAPGAMTVCCTCGSNLGLNERRPAAICKCGTLFHCEPFFDGSINRMTLQVTSYPAA